MSWRDSIVRSLGGVTRTDLDAAIAQAKEQLPLIGGADPGPGFRKLTNQPDRDLQPLTRDREIELAYFLYKTNMLAGRMVELKRDFVVGDGLTIKSTDPEVQDAIEDFWTDPVNQLDQTLGQKVLELGLYGEAAYPVFVTPNMGRVRLGYLDPGQIDQVFPDPENAAILVGIETKGAYGKKRRYPIVISAEERTVLSPAGQRLRLSFTDNPCFFFSVNRVTNATRGSSDLLRALDWLQAYEEWMFDRMEWTKQIGAFVWDILLKGADEKQIREWLRNNPPPKPGSQHAHNESVERKAVAPEMKAVEIGESQGNFKRHILLNDGWPEHWFVAGGDVNRATSVEMGDPIVKSLTARQKIVIGMVTAQIRYMLRSRVSAGSLRATVTIQKAGTEKTIPAWDAFEISAPEIASRDLARLGGVIVQVAQALAIAQTNQWIGHDDAAAVFALLAGMFGREVTPAPAPDTSGMPGATVYTPDLMAKMQALFASIGAGNGGGSV